MPIGELTCLLAIMAVSQAQQKDTIVIDAPELAKINWDLPTGGLPVQPGLETYEVFRSNKEHPELADGRGWTYQHHPDIAVWHGRLYVGWESGERDEDVWPSRELLSSSRDGKTWSKPIDMFPQGVGTALRMYFSHAPNGRMLIIAGLRENENKLNERKKGGLVVRELKADQSLGEVFVLQPHGEPRADQPPLYTTSTDQGFVKACRQLLANNLFLQTQDYGLLLPPEHRMKWNLPENWTENKELAEDFGKAMCFFVRRDGALVAVSKKRWVTVSHDHGKTWSPPVQPDSLITNMGKVWGQRTSDGRYAIIYDPDLKRRYPMIMLTSDDGITFRDPHVLHGSFGPMRYPGKAKDYGPSYQRGLNRWNDDGSFEDKSLWLVYSMNEEDIEVARVPVQSAFGNDPPIETSAGPGRARFSPWSRRR